MWKIENQYSYSNFIYNTLAEKGDIVRHTHVKLYTPNILFFICAQPRFEYTNILCLFAHNQQFVYIRIFDIINCHSRAHPAHFGNCY